MRTQGGIAGLMQGYNAQRANSGASGTAGQDPKTGAGDRFCERQVSIKNQIRVTNRVYVAVKATMGS